MIFSQRYARAIRNGALTVELPDVARKKLAEAMASHNHSVGVRRDPNDGWVDNSDVVSEAATYLKTEYAWDEWPGEKVSTSDSRQPLFALVWHGAGENVLDAIEVMHSGLTEDRRGYFSTHVNRIFDVEDCPWRLVKAECIKLDADFVGSDATQLALQSLAAGQFAGPADEYSKAAREQASGEVKNAIADACKSFESTLKILTGLEQANADRLVKGLVASGYLDDLPENVRSGFGGAVLMALPFIRNKLAGHGQGGQVVNVPQCYGALALQIAAAFQNFLISKYIEEHPPNADPLARIDFATEPEGNELPW